MRKQGSTGKCDEHSFAILILIFILIYLYTYIYTYIYTYTYILLQELIEMQQREAELAIIGKGEYRLRKKFDNLFVSANDWDKMREDQRKLALQKIHVNEIKDCQSTAVTEATSKLVHETTPLLIHFQQAGIDWIPRDHLVRIITKAVDTINQPEKVVTMDSDTYLIPSSSKPRNPHVINTFPNGKVACKDCPGFASSSVCAHAVAVCQKTGKLQMYLKWLARSKRKTGMNLWKAVSQDMPAGLGRKGERAPRKRKRIQEQPRVVITRAENVVPNAVSPLTRGSAEYVLIWYSTNSSKPAASTTNSAASTTKSTADANYLPANSRSSFWKPTFCTT